VPGKLLAEWVAANLVQSIQDIETRTSAEIVITARPRSARHAEPFVIGASVAGFLALAFAVYSNIEFSPLAVLTFPALAGGLAIVLVDRFPGLQRFMTREEVLRDAVDQAARANFLERRIHQTVRRTGVLVYLSIGERMVSVVADVGVERAVDPEIMADAVAELEVALGDDPSCALVSRCMDKLSGALETALPRGADDVNELPDEVAS
jgi:putative membrane protein